MFARNALTSLAVVFSLAVAPVMAAQAPADSAKAAAPSADVKAELAKLRKAVGAGEISTKEYNVRKEALLAGSKTSKPDGK